MKKMYKNLIGEHIELTLFGHGLVKISADAKAVELEPVVADAINGMVYPKIILQEVVEEFSAPLAIEEPEVEQEVEQEEKEAYSPADENYTIAQLRAMCDAQGIKYSARETKTILHKKLFG